MRAILAGLVSATMVITPLGAYAQTEHQPLNNLGDHIAIPGFSGKQAFTYDFQLNSFQTKHGKLFAVGMLSGGNLPSAQQIAIPVGGNRGEDGEHQHGSDDAMRGGFGSLQRSTPAQPAIFRAEQAPLFQRTALQSPAAPYILAQTTQTCNILNLNLQPLHLNLLGLVVDLQAVILDITAVTGAGNLLGNLLCALLNILNP